MSGGDDVGILADCNVGDLLLVLVRAQSLDKGVWNGPEQKKLMSFVEVFFSKIHGKSSSIVIAFL